MIKQSVWSSAGTNEMQIGGGIQHYKADDAI